MPGRGEADRVTATRYPRQKPVSAETSTFQHASSSPFTWPVRVYHEDTDSGGIVYHANHLRYLERARTEWLRACGYSQEAMKRELGVLFTVRSLEIHYRKPAFLDDALIVETWVHRHRRAALHFRQRLCQAENKEYVVCDADVEVACIGVGHFRPQPIPRSLDRELTDADSDR